MGGRAPVIRSTVKGFQPYAYVVTAYAGTALDELDRSIDSMLSQTVPPSEVVAVMDGPVSQEVREHLEALSARFDGRVELIRLAENRGPGYAAARAIEAASCDLVARLDSDDVSRRDRMEVQLKALAEDPGLSCVGSLVVERQKSTGRESYVELPEAGDELADFARRRCPCRQSTLLFSRAAVLAVGNYRDLRFAEDWDICNRLIAGGYRLRNVQEPLVTMMVDDDYYARRGGAAVFGRIIAFKFGMLREGRMGLLDFAVSAGASLLVSLAPNKLRELVYTKLLRGGHS